MIHAPFTLPQRVALTEWQECPWAHPLTCGNCAASAPLIVETRGLMCAACYHVQPHAPEECMSLPPDPATLFSLRDYEVTFFLGARLPSSQHTFACKAASPFQALQLLATDHPDALLPFVVSEATGQGEGHKPL